MNITHMRTNHLQNPLGYQYDTITLSWTVEDTDSKEQTGAQVLVSTSKDFSTLCHDSGKKEDISGISYVLPLSLEPYTRYYWKVQVWGDGGDTAQSETAWFETAKQDTPWQGKWLTSPFNKDVHPLFFNTIKLNQKPVSARLYASGLGVYEAYINGKKAGDEYLAPFYNDYNNWVQYQTYDVTSLLKKGDNALGAMVGNGWYKGRFGFVPEMDSLYGNKFLFIAELHLQFADGSTQIIGTDSSWLCGKAPVVSSSIYDGEEYDARLAPANWFTTKFDTTGFEKAKVVRKTDYDLQARLSPPVVITQRIKPRKLLRTPAGENVLDFGQLMTGWVEFNCDLPEGTTILLEHGELLQNDNFYTENLRTAKQQYRFTSNGKPHKVRPHFTFYGFRFVKITGLDDIRLKDFTGCVIHSQLEFTGSIKTSNKKVNKLIENALWGQRGNFLDVPTDCPQRDERMGWTGDAQVFAATASFNMETPAFFDKFLYDMRLEQEDLDGSVPHVVPDILHQIDVANQNIGPATAHGSCAWADAATIIPWTMYQFYGDKEALKRHFPNMQMWTDYIKKTDDADGGTRLWKTGFHFADWLALDNPEQGSSFGRTDPYFVASCYYHYSATLTAKAAQELGYKKEHSYYSKLAEQVKKAIQKEYYTATGRLAIDTQTAHILALGFGITPPQFVQRTVQDLAALLDASNKHLNSGFVGTAYICHVLSAHGLTPYAYTLLLNEDYPSWLYEVNMGATTVWERWNSVLPNGLVSDTGMNSMNHYAYGAIVEWIYRCVCGINPSAPGFAKARIAPLPDSRLKSVSSSYRSAAGLYKSSWQQIEGGYSFEVTVPFNATATFVTPGSPSKITIDGHRATPEITLKSGTYTITATYPNGIEY